MHPDQSNIELLLSEKAQELRTLREEWKKASYHPADMDYEYLAILYPIIAEKERELERFTKLLSDENTVESHFPAYIRQLLDGVYLRLEIHIQLGYGQHIAYKGPLMQFEKLKQKNAVSAKLLLEGEKSDYFYSGYYSQLSKLGWKKIGKDTSRLKHIIRNEEDLNEFHRLIACTFMEPLFYVMESTKAQHFVLIPLPQS